MLSPRTTTTASTKDVDMGSDDDFGSDIQLDDELEGILATVEARHSTPGTPAAQDIEELVPRPAPIQEFRKKGWLSVSDLVGTVWCEVQYDYRLRTMPYLPPEKRPTVITSKHGAAIPVDKVKVEGKEKILRRGEKIHKRLEREIHPQEIVVHAISREDVWGLRFLNMFSALEALITLGKCRELPVVGFVKGILIMGVIDEITREPVDDTKTKPNTRSSAKETESGKSQTSLTRFFSPTKPRARPPRGRTHRLFVSDSKTRASGTVPRDSDTLAGKLQVMMYKELLDALLLPQVAVDAIADDSTDAILPTETPFSWERLFDHLSLQMDIEFSPEFIVQSRPVVVGNDLRFEAGSARTLRQMVTCWAAYVTVLGLGEPIGKGKDAARNMGRTEDRLELVYRRAGAKSRKSRDSGEKPSSKRSNGARRKGKRKAREEVGQVSDAPWTADYDEDQALQRAIAHSLRQPTRDEHIVDRDDPSPPETLQRGVREIATTPLPDLAPQQASTPVAGTYEAAGDEDDELAWAVEMSLGAMDDNISKEEQGEVVLRASQATRTDPASSPLQHLSPAPSAPSPPSTRSNSPTPVPDVSATVKHSSTVVEEAVSSKSGSGTIIGRTVFTHSPRRLAAHLSSVLQWWQGEREAVGVSIEETRRCGWCEFEEGCEWRISKAQEAMERFRLSKSQSQA